MRHPDLDDAKASADNIAAVCENREPPHSALLVSMRMAVVVVGLLIAIVTELRAANAKKPKRIGGIDG